MNQDIEDAEIINETVNSIAIISKKKWDNFIKTKPNVFTKQLGNLETFTITNKNTINDLITESLVVTDTLTPIDIEDNFFIIRPYVVIMFGDNNFFVTSEEGKFSLGLNSSVLTVSELNPFDPLTITTNQINREFNSINGSEQLKSILTVSEKDFITGTTFIADDDTKIMHAVFLLCRGVDNEEVLNNLKKLINLNSTTSEIMSAKELFSIHPSLLMKVDQQFLIDIVTFVTSSLTGRIQDLQNGLTLATDHFANNWQEVIDSDNFKTQFGNI